MRWQGVGKVTMLRIVAGNLQVWAAAASAMPVRGKGGIVILVVVLVAGYYGIDLSPLLNGGNVAPQGNNRAPTSVRKMMSWPNSPRWCWPRPRTTGKRFSSAWANLSTAEAGDVSRRDAHQLRHRSGGNGAVLLPGDRTVYIDLSFYQDMKTKLGAGGDFAQACGGGAPGRPPRAKLLHQ